MRRSGRLQQRALWARTPDNSFRVNAPDGFLHDFQPIGWDVDVDQVGPGSWWAGSDSNISGGGLTQIGPGAPWFGGSGRTTGSPLTRPDNRPSGGGFTAGLHPAVTRCTSVIVNGITSTPWRVVSGGQDVGLPKWIVDPMGVDSITGPTGPLLPAGRRLTGSSFHATVLTHALWYGRGCFAFIENTDGQPVPGSLRVLNPYMVGLTTSGRFQLVGDGDDLVETDHDGRLSAGGVTWRVVAMRGLPPNDTVTPEGVLTRHFGLLRLGAVIHRWGERLFASGVPSGFLKVSAPNMTQEQADDLKAAWMRAHGGDRRSVAVLNATTDYTRISYSPQEMDTSSLNDDLAREIALAFSLDPVYVGQGASGLNYNNQSDRRQDLVDLTVAQWANQYMEVLTGILPLGSSCEVNWPAFTAPDLVTQGATMVQLVAAGLMTRAEARAYMGLSGDVPPEPVELEVV